MKLTIINLSGSMKYSAIAVIVLLCSCNSENIVKSCKYDTDHASTSAILETTSISDEIDTLQMKVVNHSGSPVYNYIAEDIELIVKNLKIQFILDFDVVYIGEYMHLDDYDNLRRGDDIYDKIHHEDIPNTVNVHVFDQESLLDLHLAKGSMTLGFTPVLRTPSYKTYEALSPRLDVIAVSSEGLMQQETLIHELLHYFGVDHTDQYSIDELREIGIDSYFDVNINVANPSGCPIFVTDEQVQLVKWSLYKHRKYLL